MTAATPGQGSCGCPETDGNIYHQRGTCTDPAVAALDWYADGPAQQAATPGQPTPGTPDQAAIAAHAAHREDIADWERALRAWRVLGADQRDKWRAHAAAEPGCTVCAQAASEREEAGQ